MSHDTEEWCKIWRWINLLFQKWQKLGKLTWALEIHKISTLIGFFCVNYIPFDLKKYREIIFHDTEEWCKIWRSTDMWFGKWHEQFGKCAPDHSEVSKLGLWWELST